MKAIRIAEKTPNEETTMKGDVALTTKAMAVVKEVKSIAKDDLR